MANGLPLPKQCPFFSASLGENDWDSCLMIRSLPPGEAYYGSGDMPVCTHETNKYLECPAFSVWYWRTMLYYTGESVAECINRRMDKPDKKRRAGISQKLRFAVFQRDDFRCVYCGRDPKDGIKLEVDHVHPDSKGGATTIDNLVTSCLDCNRGKGATVLDSE